MSDECGEWNMRRRRLALRRVEPDGTWWERLLCRVFWHQLACCPNHSTFVYTPQGEPMGIMCERCGGLIGGML